MKRILSILVVMGLLIATGASCGSTNRYGMPRGKKTVKTVKKPNKGCGCASKKRK